MFVDGCFWHGCPEHGTRPAANRRRWQAKATANRDRDADTTALLVAQGWTVLRFWEHEDMAQAATRITAAVRAPG